MSSYTIRELIDRTGVQKRRIRYLIQNGLLHKPDRGGRGALYNEEHLSRLRQIRKLEGGGLTMDQIRERIGDASNPPMQAPRVTPMMAAQAFRFELPRSRVLRDEAGPPNRSEVWRRISITPDVELHVRGSSGRTAARLERALRRALAEEGTDGFQEGNDNE